MVELYISEGLYLLWKHRGRLLPIVVKCLEGLVKMAFVTYGCAWLCLAVLGCESVLMAH
jgi:hypothetical protein